MAEGFASLLEPHGNPAERRTRIIVIAVALVALILVPRAVFHNPQTPALVFIFLPICVIAVGFGPLGGAVAAFTILLVTGVLDTLLAQSTTLTESDALTAALRLTGFVLSGVLTGVIADGARVLYERGERDYLTGLYTRRRFVHALERHQAEVERYGPSGAVLMLDLDGFKQVNDERGHHVGDELLRQVARRLQRRTRETDYLARLGGDEFAILLRRTDGQEAAKAAWGIVHALADEPYEVDGGQPVKVTTSVGVAPVLHHGSPAEVIVRADVAMYAAKHEGGGRVHMLGDLPVEDRPPLPSGAAPAPRQDA